MFEGVRRRTVAYFHLLRVLGRARSSFEFALPLLPILAKYRLYLPAAILVHLTIRPLTTQTTKYRVLVIEKDVFNEDVLEVVDGMAEVQAVGVKRAVLKCLALGVLPKSICDDAAYVSDDPDAEQAKLVYRTLWRKVWRYMSWFAHYDAVLTGNWCYWAEREMAFVLEDIGTPFVVMHKEGIKPPALFKVLSDRFRYPRHRFSGERRLFRSEAEGDDSQCHFNGRRMFVYQKLERDHQIEGKIARADQIVIVGMPRLDRLHRWRRLVAAGKIAPRAVRPTVLLLAFLKNNHLPSYAGIESDLAWEVLCNGTYRAAVQFAAENPDYDVIVRPRLYERLEVEELLDLAGPRPGNLKVAADGDIGPLIEASWVVWGHNTTVLLEGLAMGKPVIVPHFGESLDPRYAEYDVDLGDAAEKGRSVEDTVERLKKLCVSPPEIREDLEPAALQALNKWTGNADGKAGERVRMALMRELSASTGDESKQKAKI